MNKIAPKYTAVIVVVSLLLLLNIVSIPRGPLLHCYKDVSTYTARQASYGIPYIFMQGNVSGDNCSLPVDQLTENNALVGNSYSFRPNFLLLNVAIGAGVLATVYLITARLSQTAPKRGKRRHA